MLRTSENIDHVQWLWKALHVFLEIISVHRLCIEIVNVRREKYNNLES